MLTYFFGVSGGGGASLRGMLMAVGGGGGRSSKVVVSSGDFSNSARGAVSSGSGETEFGRESMATHGSVLETHKKLHESTATLVDANARELERIHTQGRSYGPTTRRLLISWVDAGGTGQSGPITAQHSLLLSATSGTPGSNTTMCTANCCYTQYKTVQ